MVQEMSRNVWVGVVLMCSCGLLALIPIGRWGIVFLNQLEVPYFLQMIVGLGCFWGALCAAVVNKFVHDRFDISAILDLQAQTICIRRSDMKVTIQADRIIGLQILNGPRERGGHQLNLVYRQDSSEVSRESLHTNATRHYVMRLANSYHQLTGWPILETKNS